jgi:hypothetical protein
MEDGYVQAAIEKKMDNARNMGKYTKMQKQVLRKIKDEIKDTDFDDVNWPTARMIANFLWVGFQNGLIGNDNCHYEFIYQEETPDVLTLEVHLDEKGNQKIFENMLLPMFLEFAKWNCEKGRIIFKKEKIDINDTEIVSKSIDLLEKMHKAIGNQLIEILQSHSELLPEELQKPKLLDHSGKVVTKKEYVARTQEEAKVLNSKHGEIQNKLEERLKNENKYKLIKKENGFEKFNYKIDLLAQKNDGHYDIYEVKPYPTATQCIREALGQVFFYKYLLEKGEYTVDALYIVGPSKLSSQEEEFLKSIMDSMKKIKIDYISIN